MSNAHSAPLGEIQAYVDDLESRLSAARAGYLDNINNSNLATIADISNLTATEIAYLDAKVSEVVKQVALTGHPSDSLGKILYDFSNTRLTAARCAFLANINNVNLSTIGDISSLSATEISHLDADISSAGGSPYSMIEFWSVPIATIAVPSTATDTTLSDVVIPNLTDLTIVKAYALMSIDAVTTGVAAIKLSTNTHIQVDKAAAGYIDAIEFKEEAIITIADARTPMMSPICGNIDISTRVANNVTTNFRWEDLIANDDGMVLKGIRTGIRLIVS